MVSWKRLFQLITSLVVKTVFHGTIQASHCDITEAKSHYRDRCKRVFVGTHFFIIIFFFDPVSIKLSRDEKANLTLVRSCNSPTMWSHHIEAVLFCTKKNSPRGKSLGNCLSFQESRLLTKVLKEELFKLSWKLFVSTPLKYIVAATVQIKSREKMWNAIV